MPKKPEEGVESSGPRIWTSELPGVAAGNQAWGAVRAASAFNYCLITQALNILQPFMLYLQKMVFSAMRIINQSNQSALRHVKDGLHCSSKYSAKIQLFKN